MPGQDNKPIEYNFILLNLKYLNNLTFKDELMVKSFKYLNTNSYQKLFQISKEEIINKYKKLEFDKSLYWINVIELFACLLDSKQINDENDINIMEELMNIFVSLIQFNAFSNGNEKNLLDSICHLLTSFYSLNIKKNINIQKSIITTLIEASLNYKIKNPIDVTETIGEILPILFNDFHYDLTLIYKNISELNSKEKSFSFFNYVLSSFNIIIQYVNKSHYIKNIQKSINNILINNIDNVLNLYITFIHKSNHLFKVLLIESLCLLFNTKFHSISKRKVHKRSKRNLIHLPAFDIQSNSSNNEIHQPQSERSTKRRFFSRFNKTTSSRNTSSVKISEVSSLSALPILTSSDNFVNNFNLSLKRSESIYKKFHTLNINNKIQQININFKENVYDIITKNNFKMFRKPILNIELIRAGISCCINYHIHDKLFEYMTNKYKKNLISLKEVNRFSIFYIAWFKQIINDWSIEDFIVLAKVSRIHDFISMIQPSISFIYYIKLFYKIIKDKNILNELVIECFFKQILKDPVSYGKAIDIKKMGFKIDEFIECLKTNKEYLEFINSLLYSISYYPLLISQTFRKDKEIILKYLSNKPPNIGIIHKVKNPITKEVRTFSEMNIINKLKLKSLNWIIYIGKNDNIKSYYIKPKLIPDLDFNINLYHFCQHFSKNKLIELFIDASEDFHQSKEEINTIIKLLPFSFTSRIQKITLLNPSNKFINELKEIIVDYDTSKINFELDTNYTFDIDDFNNIYDHRGYFEVNSNSLLYIRNNSFVLSKPIKFYDKEIKVTQIINNISSINLVENKVIFKDINNDNICELNTKSFREIKNSFEAMRNKFEIEHLLLNFDEVENNISNNYIAELIGLTIILMSSNINFLYNPSLQLYESIINKINNNKSEINNSDIYTFTNLSKNLNTIFNEIKELEIFDDIVIVISNYIKKLFSNDSLTKSNIQIFSNLMPLFVIFINSCKNKCYINHFLNIIFPFLQNDDILSIIEYPFWNKIQSKIAIKLIFQYLFSCNYNIIILRRIMQALIDHSASNLFGKILIFHFLDGNIRRKSFNSEITFEKIFSIIVSLPFISTNFIIPNLLNILFYLVIALTHSTSKTTKNIKIFLTTILESLNANDLIIEFDTIIENQYFSSFDLIEFFEKISLFNGKNSHEEFLRLMIEDKPDDNQETWYIKSAFAAQHNIIKPELAQKYIDILPSLMISEFGERELIIAFIILSKSINTIIEPNKIFILFWTTLLSSNHSNYSIRKSAISLLTQIIETSLINIDFSQLKNSGNLTSGVKAYAESLNIDFVSRFPFAFLVALTKALEMEDTRNLVLELFSICIQQLIDQPLIISIYVLPFVVYARDNYKWILRLKFKEFKPNNFPELIFYNFAERTAEEKVEMITYIGNSFCECSFGPKFDEIAECIIYGLKHFLSDFAVIKERIENMCWKMIKDAQDQASTEMLAEIVAGLLCVEGCEGMSVKTQYQESDDVLMTEIFACLNCFAETTTEKHERNRRMRK